MAILKSNLAFAFMIFTVASTSGLVSCAPVPETAAHEKIHAIDGVKLISKDIIRGDDLRTFGQPTFTVDPDRRLLIRYETLMAQSGIREDRPLRLRVYAMNENDAAIARVSLKACPIIKSWMMAASWNSGHPWAGGSWRPGGAIDESSCISVEVIPTEVKPSVVEKPVVKDTSDAAPLDCSAARALCFDVTAWYKTWVVQRHENFGLALISDRPVALIGTGSPALSPRIHWFESTTIGLKF